MVDCTKNRWFEQGTLATGCFDDDEIKTSLPTTPSQRGGICMPISYFSFYYGALASKFQTIIQWSGFSCMMAWTKNVWFEQGTLAIDCFDDEAGNKKLAQRKTTMLLLSLPLVLLMMSRIVLLCTLWTIQPENVLSKGTGLIVWTIQWAACFLTIIESRPSFLCSSTTSASGPKQVSCMILTFARKSPWLE